MDIQSVVGIVLAVFLIWLIFRNTKSEDRLFNDARKAANQDGETKT